VIPNIIQIIDVVKPSVKPEKTMANAPKDIISKKECRTEKRIAFFIVPCIFPEN
jgi:hypothetical protein